MKKVIVILFLFFSALGFSQSKKVAYTPDFNFREGIYLNINQFTNNNPIPVSSIRSNIPKNGINFLDELVKQKEIVYMDSSGNEQRIATTAIWGYSQNRIIHIYYSKKFARINVIGTLCQFTAIVTSTVTYQNPMYMGMPGYGFGTTTSTIDEMKQFILDTRNNDIGDFSEQNMEALLQDDDELYKEFIKLKRRQRKDSIFIYIRKYNERHPLLLPVK